MDTPVTPEVRPGPPALPPPQTESVPDAKHSDLLVPVPAGGADPPDAAFGDRVFSQLHTVHRRRLHALAYRLTGEHAAADDIVQESFLHLYTLFRQKGWSAFGSGISDEGGVTPDSEADRRIRSWLSRAVGSRAYNWLRDLIHHRRALRTRGEHLWGPPPRRPDEERAWRLEEKKVNDLLLGLPHIPAMVIDLHRRGVPAIWIAHFLQLPRGSISRHLKRARRLLGDYYRCEAEKPRAAAPRRVPRRGSDSRA